MSLGDEYNSPTHIIASLRTNTRIDNLHNGGVGKDNYLISFSWGTMVETLQVTTTVTTLDISCNTVIDDDVKKLTDALKKNTTVTLFHLDHSPLEGVGACGM